MAVALLAFVIGLIVGDLIVTLDVAREDAARLDALSREWSRR